MAVRWGSVQRVREGLRRCGARHLVAAALVLPFSVPASADPAAAPPSKEVWAGADVSSNVWLAYSGMTVAPWGGIYDNGVRFRAAGGYGEYSYEKARSDDPSFDSARGLNPHARPYFADILVGYLQRFGELTAKAFVGVSIISHEIAPLDPETVAIGEEIGVKGVLEFWLNMGDRGWGSLDLSWSSAHNTRTARGRVGYRVWPKLSLGLEAGVNVDAQGECRLGLAGASECKTTGNETVEQAGLLDYARGGAFARYEWDRGEVSVSAGVLGDSFSTDGSTEISPYVTVNWLTQF
jgi:hypothetical protein